MRYAHIVVPLRETRIGREECIGVAMLVSEMETMDEERGPKTMVGDVIASYQGGLHVL